MEAIVKIALVNKDNHILLNLRSKNAKSHPHQWAFFGGKVEPDENYEDALVREIKEELNFDLKEFKKVCELKEDNKIKIFYVGKCDIPLSDLTLGEGEDFKFFSFAQTKDLAMPPSARKVLSILFK